MFCKKCGTQLNPEGRFCKKCGTPMASAAPAASPPTTPLSGVQPNSYEPAPTYTVTTSSVVQRQINPRFLWIGVVLAAGLIAVGYYYYSRLSLERKLEAAIANKNLLKPPGESAFDYYKQLKQKGLSAQLTEKLMPVLTAHPQQMIADLEETGKVNASLADWQDAQILLAWASELRPNDNVLASRASYCTARVSYLSDRKDEAITAWKRAAEQDATWGLPLNSIGIVHLEKKKYSIARSFFFEAVRREPKFAIPYSNLGNTFLNENDIVQAEKYFQQSISHSSQRPYPHLGLGEIAMRRNDYNRAAQEYETVLTLDPSGSSGFDVNWVKQKLEQARQGATSQSAAEDSFAYTDVHGFIGNLKILFTFSERNGHVTGSYRYEGRNESLRLEGNVSNDGIFTLTEFAPDGQRTGSLVFKGTPGDADVVYSGTWSSADGKRKLPFKLEPLGD